MPDPWAQFPDVNDAWSMFPDADPRTVDGPAAPTSAPTAAVDSRPQWPFVDARLPSTLPWLAQQPAYAPAASGVSSADSGTSGLEETQAKYDQNLRDVGIDPTTFYSLPKPLRDYIRSIMDSGSFKSTTEPIYQKDVKLKKETGGILDYLSPSGDYDDPDFRWQNRIVPYEGKPETDPSPQSTAGMDAPAPDPSMGIPMFEWHAHPITQPGGNLPSEKDLARSLKYNLPGAIWYNNGYLFGGPTPIIYQAHQLERKNRGGR